MNDLSCFFNVQIHDSGILASLGDSCFAPIRYFFHGKTAWNEENTVHHVSSFHKEPCHRSNYIKYRDNQNNSISTEHCSYQKNWLTTIGAIIMLVPGVFLGTIVKSMAYLCSSMRERHILAKQHFTPINIQLGSEDRILDEEGIQRELEEKINNPLHPKIEALILYGNENIVIHDTDARILALNPKKIILVGPQGQNRNDPDMPEGYARFVGCYRPPVQTATSVQEALDRSPERRPFYLGGKPYKMMYRV